MYYVSLADPKGFLALSLAFPAQTLMISVCTLGPSRLRGRPCLCAGGLF